MSDDTSPALGTAPPRATPPAAPNTCPTATAPSPEDLEWTPAVETVLTHRSVRAFAPEPLTERQLATIIAAAQSAPTSSNLHLWSVIVVNDAVLRDRIGPGRLLNQSENFVFIQQAPTILLLVAAASRNEDIMTAAGASTGSLDYLDS
ncbi:nitroreductase family protein [Actinomyces gaoshouyii]|uniref:nitroreductase family protein n=1 Tax=Actinomyces gaoshouyii TaxID=1960083 RepID=UPI0009BC9838|nr:nitroreductase family protein [Actinomyces gaoshouyii]ARD42380.1 hypothetical protein B6G06_08540 [Actinomyces gaoshouyii]